MTDTKFWLVAVAVAVCSVAVCAQPPPNKSSGRRYYSGGFDGNHNQLLGFAGLADEQAAKSQPPPTKGKGERDPPQAQAGRNQGEPQIDLRGTQNAPFVVNIPKSQEEADQEQRDRNEKTSADKLAGYLAGLTVLVGLLQVALLYVQTSIIGKQRDIMKEQRIAADRQASIADQQRGIMDLQRAAAETQSGYMLEGLTETRNAVEVSRQQHASAERANAQSLQLAQLDRRAWVGIATAQMVQMEVGRPLIADVSFTNCGRTPAIGLTCDSTLVLNVGDIDVPAAVEHHLGQEPLIQSGTLFPGVTKALNIILNDPLTAPQLAQLRSGRITLYILGTLRYDAGFTEFAFKYQPINDRFGSVPGHERAT